MQGSEGVFRDAPYLLRKQPAKLNCSATDSPGYSVRKLSTGLIRAVFMV